MSTAPGRSIHHPASRTGTLSTPVSPSPQRGPWWISVHQRRGVSAYSTYEIAMATPNFFCPLHVRTCLGFCIVPFGTYFHVMFFSLLFCLYYLMNRYFLHVLHQQATRSASAHSFSFFLLHSTTDLLQDSSTNCDPTLCTSFVRASRYCYGMSQSCLLCFALLLLLIK